MKKKFSRLLCMTLVLSVLLSFAGCGASDKKKLVGTWNTTMDLTDMTNELLTAANPDMAEYITLSGCSIDLVYTFNEDGTYQMVLVNESLKEWSQNILESTTAGLRKYLDDQAREEGLTADDLLAVMGLDLDELLEMSLDTTVAIQESVRNAEESGTYELKDGQLFTTPDSGTPRTYAYEFISNTEMKMTEAQGDSIVVSVTLTLKKQ